MDIKPYQNKKREQEFSPIPLTFQKNIAGLTFRELESGAGGFLTVFFPFFGSGVASNEARLFEDRSKLRIGEHQRSGDPMPNGAGLTGNPTADYADFDIESAGRIGKRQWLRCNRLSRLKRKIVVD